MLNIERAQHDQFQMEFKLDISNAFTATPV